MQNITVFGYLTDDVKYSTMAMDILKLKKTAPKNPYHKTESLGDAVHSLPFLNALRDSFQSRDSLDYRKGALKGCLRGIQ